MFIIESPDEIGRDSIGSNSSSEVAKFVASETLFDEPATEEAKKDVPIPTLQTTMEAIRSEETVNE